MGSHLFPLSSLRRPPGLHTSPPSPRIPQLTATCTRPGKRTTGQARLGIPSSSCPVGLSADTTPSPSLPRGQSPERSLLGPRWSPLSFQSLGSLWAPPRRERGWTCPNVQGNNVIANNEHLLSTHAVPSALHASSRWILSATCEAGTVR